MATEYAKHDTTGFLLKGILDTIDAMDNLEDVAALGSELNSIIAHARQRWQDLRTSPVQAAAAPVQASTLELIDGKYTVQFDDGSHVTLRVKTQDETSNFMPGKQVVAYLNGPDNWSNYQSFGTIANGTLRSFRKYEGQLPRQRAALAIILGSTEGMIEGLQGYGVLSGKCGMCGRELTHPDSIALGIGPDCAKKLGI